MTRLTFAWDVLTCLAIFVGGSCIYAPDIVHRVTTSVVKVELEPDGSLKPMTEKEMWSEEYWASVDKAAGTQ